MNHFVLILLFPFTFCVAHQELYTLNNNMRANFTKLDIKPYSGIRECIEACNIDENCYAFGVKSTMKSDDQVDCYINNGTGPEVLDAGVEIMVKFGKHLPDIKKCTMLEDIMTKNIVENTPKNKCPGSFVMLENLTGCYHPAVNEHVTWQEAEDACQNLDSRAHLISFDSPEVRLFTWNSDQFYQGV